jgi:hypothetical protein
MDHTTPNDPNWVEWTADMDRRIAEDYSRSSYRIVVRRYLIVSDCHPMGLSQEKL